MTATTTPRDMRSQINGAVPTLDSPAVPERARARMRPTERDVKARKVGKSRQVPTLAGWWVWTQTPASFADTWAASAVDRTRIPAGNTVLYVLWLVSNWTDRLVMFAVIAVFPTFLTGPLRWCAAKPTRRYALYLTVAALAVTFLIGVN